jgi:hypothetical protein
VLATGTVREDIDAEVSREALRDWEWANAYNHFSEYRKLMNPRFKLKGPPAVGSDFSTHRCRILFWTSPNRRCVLIICRRSPRVIVLSRGCGLCARPARSSRTTGARDSRAGSRRACTCRACPPRDGQTAGRGVQGTERIILAPSVRPRSAARPSLPKPAGVRPRGGSNDLEDRFGFPRECEHAARPLRRSDITDASGTEVSFPTGSTVGHSGSWPRRGQSASAWIIIPTARGPSPGTRRVAARNRSPGPAHRTPALLGQGRRAGSDLS